MAKKTTSKVTVYYDGACPSCVKGRDNYQKLSGNNNVFWQDITHNDDLLLTKGIDPKKALTELHIEIENQGIVSEMEAYRVLMSRSTALKPLAWLLSVKWFNFCVSKIYHWQVHRRLKRQGRI